MVIYCQNVVYQTFILDLRIELVLELLTTKSALDSNAGSSLIRILLKQKALKYLLE